jgi:hypothetical protein
MKNMKKSIALWFCSASLLLGISACSKMLQDARDNITSAEDFAASETEAAGLFDVSDDMNETNQQSTVVPAGATFRWLDSVSVVKVYELDFGPLGTSVPKGKLCGDGRYRAGKVRISVSYPYTAVGAIATVTTTASDLYYCGDGTGMTQVITDISVKRTAPYAFEIIVNNSELIFSDGKTATHKGVRNVTKISGQSTYGIWGDEYEVTGNGSGVNREGDAYQWNVTTPLLKRMQLGCARTFVKGVIAIENDDAQNPLEVDFDPFNNAACDRTAKAIYGNRSVNFTVR